MIDPALLVLAAGVAAAGFQAITSLWRRSGVKWAYCKRDVAEDGQCFFSVVFEDLSCLYENSEAVLHAIRGVTAYDLVKGVVIAKKNVSKDKLLARLENTIMSLRVVLEREPGNPRLERRLRLLQSIYERIRAARQPVEAVIAVIVGGSECRETEELASKVASELRGVGCRVRIVKGLGVIGAFYGLAKGSVADEGVVSSVVGRLVETSNNEGVYIGIDEHGRPFFLPLRGREGSLHYIVLGPTGRGKTTLAAILLLRAEALGLRVYGVDPKGDLARYAAKLGLGVHRVSLREAMHAVLWLYREEVIARDSVFTTLSSLGVELEAVEESIDSCKPLGAVATGKSRLRIERIGLADVNPCNAPSIPSDGIVYDVSRLPEGLKGGMAAVTAFAALRKGGLLVIDEAWRLTKTVEQHVIRLYKEARSMGLSIVALTQDPGDLPPEAYNNVRGVILFGSGDEGYIARVARITGLEPSEARVLRSLGVGRILVKLWGFKPLIVEVDASELTSR